MKKLVLTLVTFLLPLGAEPYKMAVIGLVHSHVWGHLPRMIKSDAVKLVGIAERNPELVAEAKKEGADVPYFDDYNKMLDETKPQIVWAFVENNRHLEIVKACAPRKIHVMFEKPLASNYKEAAEIQQLAKKYDIQIMTNYQMAWWPANYVAKAQVDSGAIGKLWRLHGVVGHGGPGSQGPRNKFFFDWLTDPVQNGAGSLVDFGCYNALWSLWYMGRPTKVYAQVNHLRPETFPKVEDNADLMLSYPNGVGIFEGSWDLPASYQDVELFGLAGNIYMKNGKVTLRKSGRNSETQEVALEKLPPERAEPIAFMANAIRSNRPIEGLTALDINVGVVEIIDAAKESIKSGRAIELKAR
jgi:scyllo-inositol 2-dehydrogenase (NADP+)